ncbi:TOTE conflict system archaeo-eukaryotic primase domain-containing protein [Methylocaldum gracile]|uniref:TOTE conflict system archaeo-eukaryotic primase domain-containing protein n=1 Tax=unclassified Methylocaldum TaxID=2622260 RepID=UPI003DA0EE00
MASHDLTRPVGSKPLSSPQQLKLASYDRFFPNRDTMPKGGFGNNTSILVHRNELKIASAPASIEPSMSSDRFPIATEVPYTARNRGCSHRLKFGLNDHSS